MSDSSETTGTGTAGDVPPPVIGVPTSDPGPAQGQDVDTNDEERTPVLELRQVAGLTAGSVMKLHQGSFQFRESNKEVGFSLVVNAVDDVSVIPGAADALIDEIAIDRPTPLGSSILNVGSACFSVRPPRPERDPQHLTTLLESARRPSRAIHVPDLAKSGPIQDQAASSRFGSLFARREDGEAPMLDAADWAFLESIRDARSEVAERHRYLHPNPEELRSRLDRLDPGLWDRTTEHPLFGRIAVAYSTIPWEPRFDDPEQIPTDLHEPIREMSCLPWVPITANLLFGPLAIVGSRSAALACARGAVLSLACLTSPRDIEFSIVTAQGLVEDWNWTSSLPNSLFPTGGDNYCIAVADGMSHFEGAGFDYEAVLTNDMGLIVLAESFDELPDGCGTIVEITPNGQCRVTNHLNEQIVGTPIGVTGSFAASTSALVRQAVGDDPEELSSLAPSHRIDINTADRSDPPAPEHRLASVEDTVSPDRGGDFEDHLQHSDPIEPSTDEVASLSVEMTTDFPAGYDGGRLSGSPETLPRPEDFDHLLDGNNNPVFDIDDDGGQLTVELDPETGGPFTSGDDELR